MSVHKQNLVGWDCIFPYNRIISCRITTEWENFNHHAKKNEMNSNFNLIYSSRSSILDNLNLSIEDSAWRCTIVAPQFRTRD